MKFIREIPKADEAATQQLLKEGWKPLKEPEGIEKAALLSLPFMIINSLVFAVLIYFIYPPFQAFLTQEEFSLNLNLNFLLFFSLLARLMDF